MITQTITQSSAVFSCYLDNTRIRIILEACAEARRLPQVQQVAGKRFLRRRWPFPFVEHVARLRGVRALASTQVQVGDVVQLHCTKLALGARVRKGHAQTVRYH